MRRVNGTIDAAVDPQILVRTKEFFKVETETYMNIMFLGLYGECPNDSNGLFSAHCYDVARSQGSMSAPTSTLSITLCAFDI